MATRELPLRLKRGKNNFYIAQIDNFKDEKTRASLIRPTNTREQPNTDFQKKQPNFTKNRRDTYNENKKQFKFTRGLHYFYDLNQLQRLSQSVSYAIFASKNKYTITYSNDNKLIGDTPISALINRNYIGLPKHVDIEHQCQQTAFLYNQNTVNQVLQLKRNDKNQCHHYLFQSEDKKHNLDRMIKQLEFIKKKINFFLLPKNIEKLKTFSIIEKDTQLSAVFFKEKFISNQEKIEVLSQKIQLLYEKRQKLNTLHQNVSQTYYVDSLDQRLFNAIKQEKKRLNRFQIYREMQKSMKQHQKQGSFAQNSTILTNFHNLHRQSQCSINSEIEDYFCIDSKSFDPFIMQKALQIISIRLFHEGQNCFYFGKKIFLKLFNKEIKLKKQIKSVKLDEYMVKIKQIEENMEKFWEKKQKKETQIRQISLNQSAKLKKQSQLAKNTTIQKVSTKQVSLKINQKIVPVDFYEYFSLKIFEALHDALLVIKQFLQRYQNKRANLIQNFASLFYPKIQSRLLTIVQQPKFGLLSSSLDRLMDVITHKTKQFEHMNYEIYVQYNQKNKEVVTFVKQVQSNVCSEQSSFFKRPGSVSSLINSGREDFERQIQIQSGQEDNIVSSKRIKVK